MAKRAFFLDFYSSEGSLFKFARPLQKTISGTVKDADGNPLAREIRLYRREDWRFSFSALSPAPCATTTSDAGTGAFSFTVNEGDKMKWVVICVGLDNENTLVYQEVTTIED